MAEGMPLSTETEQQELERITNEGERMIVGNMWGYWAHLSIYFFALPYTKGKRVLEAGTGSGYGSAYLARHGANVLGFDAGEEAVLHSRRRYAGDPVTYEVADLNKPIPVGDRMFDVVFSSNVFEHVANIDGLVAECARVVRQDGVVIVAVPPITSAAAAEEDIRNQFHVHHIPPSAWKAKLERFFEEVECRRHVGKGIFADKEREQQELRLSPDKVTIRETDFEFPVCDTEDFITQGGITAVFVCRNPRERLEFRSETIAERTPSEWAEGARAAKVITDERNAIARAKTEIEQPRARIKQLETAYVSQAAEIDDLLAQNEVLRQHLREHGEIVLELKRSPIQSAGESPDAMQQLYECRSHAAKLEAAIAAIRSSTSWRITAPIRALKRVFRD